MTRLYRILALGLCLLPLLATALTAAPPLSYPGADTQTLLKVQRGETDMEKLSPELVVLYEQFTATGRDLPTRSYDAEQLDYLFGIAADARNPVIQVKVTLAPGADSKPLAAFMAIHSEDDGGLRGSIPVPALGKLAASEAVTAVSAFKGARNPAPPARPMARTVPARSVKRGQAEQFDKQGLDGEGVIVAVIDTGIDWKHADFRDASGNTRLLYLWDFVDESFDGSDGAIGNQAPVTMPGLFGIELHYGTLYDRDQINAALRGEGACGSVDLSGHGTACMSIAAGNGLATGGVVEPGTWAGLAPGADLIAVRAGDGSFDDRYIHAVKWIIDTAASLGRPCVINLSLGGHYSSHDGFEEAEQVLNSLVGAGHPGAVVCVSAGNEGRSSFHAAGRFGPRREGQMDVDSPGV